MEKKGFIDYYELLQIHPNAEKETINRVYRLLARRYHPDNNNGTGDADKFNAIYEAYKLLSDPDKRKAYDTDYKARPDPKYENFFQAPWPGDAETDRRMYEGILCLLYIARRRDALNPGVGIVHLEKVLGCPEKQLEFYIWYLKEKGWIQRLETGKFAITVSGVDAVIEKDILLRKDRLLAEGNEFSTNSEEPLD